MPNYSLVCDSRTSGTDEDLASWPLTGRRVCVATCCISGVADLDY